MDFFESQELARRNTKWLVFLFGLAVLAIIAALYTVAVIVLALGAKEVEYDFLAAATNWKLLVGIIGSVLFVIGIGSGTKMLELRQGGSAVASLMGGRRIVGNTNRLTDRRVANVVEEMALASGTPVPPVYILDDEQNINAFAAGFTVDDAVIGINRGTAEKLSREELQGVVAHEFSHILNGDMRMSLRMVSILNGILLISIIGGQLLSFLTRTSHVSRRRSSGDKKEGGGVAVIWIIAISLYLIGSIGLFFGRWIKSMISKQREYLADASAVQFTRIPEGIAGALKVIGGSDGGAKLSSGNAEQISHMFFGTACSSFFFATHPPLINRIQQIDERFDGNFQGFMVERQRKRDLLKQTRERDETQSREEKIEKLMDFLPGSDRFEAFKQMKFPINPLILIAGIGIPTTEDVEYSGFMVNKIPEEFLRALRETFSARCVVFASLLNEDEESLKKQLEIIHSSEAKGSLESTVKIKKLYDELPVQLRLGAFEIIQGTLSAMSPGQYPVFRKTVNDLIVADRQVDLFEFFLFHHLIVHLDRCFKPIPARQNLYKSLAKLKTEISHMISVLACVGQRAESDQRIVFNAAFSSLFGDGQHDQHFVANWDHEALSKALSKVAQATPMLKKQVLTAAVMAISHDKILTVQEVELFRAMSESLDCPVPPLVATRDEAPELPDPEVIA